MSASGVTYNENLKWTVFYPLSHEASDLIYCTSTRHHWHMGVKDNVDISKDTVPITGNLNILYYLNGSQNNALLKLMN